MRPLLEAIGVDPQPQQVREPRKDPFFFWLKAISINNKENKDKGGIINVRVTKRQTDIGPPHYEQFLPACNQEKLRQMEIP